MSASAIPADNVGFALKLSDNPELALTERFSLQSKPMLPLQKGQVRVKMAASPINPSDLVHLMGKYGLTPIENQFVGFEGCGVVVQANAGLYGRYLLGKRVALSAAPGQDGLWAQYATTFASYCLPVNNDIADDQASTLIVNPLTAVCLVERAKQLGTKAIVINAGASQVGKAVIRYALTLGLPVIATVRNPKNRSKLTVLGASAVLCTTDEDYLQQLKALCKQYQARVLLDAVADKDTAQVLACMPAASTAIVYGRLTETHDPLGGYFSVADVIFRQARIEGFWLANFMKRANPWTIYRLSHKVQQLFSSGIFATDIRASVGFNQFPSLLADYAANKSEGKVILKPWLNSNASKM